MTVQVYHTLKLAVGATVMLRRNILCEDGLNGARGIVVAFRWRNGGNTQAADEELPEGVLVNPLASESAKWRS